MLTGYVRYRWLLRRLRPRRYTNLMKTIHEERCRRIVEIGVWNGLHAVQMIATASNRHPVETIEYFGFDLFEQLSDDLLKTEFSKRPPAVREVQNTLERTGARIRLYQGDTRTTLGPALQEIGAPDFVFVDGGHSVASVMSDWEAVRAVMAPHTTVIFDDYYVGAGADLANVGCQTIIDAIDPIDYAVDRLHPVDEFRETWGTRRVAMVRVRRRR